LKFRTGDLDFIFHVGDEQVLVQLVDVADLLVALLLLALLLMLGQRALAAVEF